MKVLCAWCLKEGKPEAESLIGEKEPVNDEHTSHGICPHHRQEVEDRVTRLREEIRRQADREEELRRQAAELVHYTERNHAEAEDIRRKVDP